MSASAGAGRVPPPTDASRGEPHSESALAGLSKLIGGERGTLYLACEIAFPDHFPKLKERARAFRKTVLIMPTSKRVHRRHRKCHKDALQSWRQFMSSLSPGEREHVQLRICSRPFSGLYTSACCENLARFRIRRIDSDEERRGHMIEVEKDTSLHRIIGQEYSELLRQSYPSFSLHPWPWARSWFGRRALDFLVFAVIGFCAYCFLRQDSGKDSTFLLKVGVSVGPGVLVRAIGDWISAMRRRSKLDGGS